MLENTGHCFVVEYARTHNEFSVSVKQVKWLNLIVQVERCFLCKGLMGAKDILG